MLSSLSSALRKATTHYVKWVVDHCYLVAVISIGLTALLSFQAKNLDVESNYKYFYSGEAPKLIAFNDMEETFTKSDNSIFAIQPKHGAITDPEILQIVYEMTQRLWEMPYTVRVDSIANYQYTRADGDDIIVGDLIENPYALDAIQAQKIIDIAASKPELTNRLIRVESNTLGIIARANIEQGDNEALEASATYAYDLQDEFQARYPDVNFELTGFVTRGYLFYRLPIDDTSKLVPCMFGLLILIMWLLTRSITCPLITIGLVALASGSAMGAGALFNIPITTISSSAPIIILTVAVADSIHVLMSYLMLIGKGVSRNEAIVQSMEINAQPVLLTTLTTAIGFLSLNFSASPPYQDLGNFAAFGTLAAWVLSMTYLPAMLAIIPIKPTPWVERQVSSIAFIARLFVRHRTPGFLLVVLVSVMGVFALPRLEFNEEYSKFFADEIGENQSLQFITANLVGPYQISYKINAKGPNGIYEPEYLNHLERFIGWLNQQPEVSQVYGINSTMKNLNRSLHGDDERYYRISDSKELNAQYLLLYELSLPYGLDVNDQINIDKSATRLDVSTYEMKSRDYTEFSNRIDQWMEQNLPGHMHSKGSSITVLFAEIGISNFESMKIATLAAFVLISVCIGLSLNSLRLGIVSMILNVIPFIILFGFLAFNGEYLAVWTVFMVPTALGLIVDATVHFLSKYNYARTFHGQTLQEGIIYSFTQVGMALWVSTLILVLGFLILTMASVQTLEMLGLGTSVTILLALVVDFMALPVLLLVSEKFGPQKSVDLIV